MKTIIAPTDFSAVSHNACLYAAHMAQDIKAELILMHVMELPLAVAEFPVAGDVIDEISVEAELEKIKNELIAETNNNVKIEIRNILGSAEYQIKELCKTTNPFAVIMGTHSYTAIDRFFGSTTVYSARHLDNAVLVVPADAKYKPIKKIALATDLKDVYKTPVQEMEILAKYFNARLEIFYIGKDQKDINKHSIESALLGHRLSHLKPHFYFVEDEDIILGITSLAKKHETDMIIIIPKKHGPFHKSQTKDCIFYSSIPVLVVHENDFVHQS